MSQSSFLPSVFIIFYLLTIIAMIPIGLASIRSQIILLLKYSTGSHYKDNEYRVNLGLNIKKEQGKKSVDVVRPHIHDMVLPICHNMVSRYVFEP